MTEKVSQIRVEGSLIGLTGLEEVFQRLARQDLSSPEAMQEELLRQVAANNYIPPGRQTAYRQALWREFRRFRGEAVAEENGSGVQIVILGAGCVGCRRLYQQVVDYLSRRGLKADVQYLTDPECRKNYGQPALPALIVNGQVALAGRLPTAAELTGILAKALKEK
ncbi:MAG: thioredoxin family protein [Thermodesulfobacteriota bacterium]